MDAILAAVGVSRDDLELLEAEAVGNADELELGVQDANVAARRLYEKAGSREVEARTEIGFRILRKALTEGG